jgi:predicted RNase H-like nuclease (RuvC/YqgF family)
MFCGITKTIVRAGLITAVAGGVAVAVAGPDTVRAFLKQARNNAQDAIGKAISDPVALRAQMQSLAEQYPARIAEVRGDLGELTEQIAQLEREQAVAKKVVAMADTDLDGMKSVLARAESARETGEAQVVKVRFDDSRSAVNLDEAYAKANRVTQLRNAYNQKVSDIDRDLGYLNQQKERLATLLDQLNTEHTEFQSQLFGLNQQVEAIQRNDRMIDLMEKRQASIEQHGRYRAASIDQVKTRLADIRAKQEAKLDAFGQAVDVKNYENAAKYLLDSESSPTLKPKSLVPSKTFEIRPSVMEIGPKDARSIPGPVVIQTGPVAQK